MCVSRDHDSERVSKPASLPRATEWHVGLRLREYYHQQRRFRFAVFFAPHLALRLIELFYKLFDCWSM
jgi:hypothetical protein